MDDLDWGDADAEFPVWGSCGYDAPSPLAADKIAFIEIKLALADYLREIRRAHRWTQSAMADRLGSSQSRVAMMENANASVSVDSLLRSVLKLGATREGVGHAILNALY